jgi:polyisoprenoid-binding protein YceI
MATIGRAETDLCKPFADGTVDSSIVERMLAVADDGHLYRIQPASSKVGFCVDSPVGRIEGQFKDFRGGLTLVPTVANNQQAMVMLDTNSLETNTPFIEAVLKSEQFFDVGQFPKMLFVSKRFRWVNDAEAVLIGDLTLRGVTREVGFHVELINTGEVDASQREERILVKATTLISRTQFGLDALSSTVNDDVSLCMSVEAVRYRDT